MERSESITNLATALCKFQGEVSKIPKDSINPLLKSEYASLGAILDVIRDPLHKNGLAVVQFPNGELGLITILTHTSGEFIAESFEMDAMKKDPQAHGARISYMRRYATLAVLNLASYDNDAEGQKITEEEVLANLTAVLKKIKTIKALDELSTNGYKGWEQNAKVARKFRAKKKELSSTPAK